jgi:hypothetical protein
MRGIGAQLLDDPEALGSAHRMIAPRSRRRLHHAGAANERLFRRSLRAGRQAQADSAAAANRRLTDRIEAARAGSPAGARRQRHRGPINDYAQVP